MDANSSVAPFDVRDGRAMVSLGPLSPKKFCTFKCPFCYVHAHFESYASLSTPEIVRWLETISEPYDVVYVSGDTDSFARPRTDRGLELLEALAPLGVDLLFTTRFVFSREDLKRIEAVNHAVVNNGRLLFGCVSVAQMTVPHLEPPPISLPGDRLAQLARLREIGVVPILAIRPFLPVVPESDYTQILEAAAGERVGMVLGGVWFADSEGFLEAGVFEGPTPDDVHFDTGVMDFDPNDAVWKVYRATATERHVRRECERLSLAFFMRSRPLIEAARVVRLSTGSSGAIQ